MRRDPLREVAAIKAWADAEFAAKGPKPRWRTFFGFGSPAAKSKPRA